MHVEYHSSCDYKFRYLKSHGLILFYFIEYSCSYASFYFCKIHGLIGSLSWILFLNSRDKILYLYFMHKPKV